MGRTAAQILRELREAAEETIDGVDRGINAEYARLDADLKRKRRITLPHEEEGREIEKIFRDTKRGVKQ